MLNITVWLDGDSVEITGTIDTGIVLTPSSAGYSLFKEGFESFYFMRATPLYGGGGV